MWEILQMWRLVRFFKKIEFSLAKDEAKEIYERVPQLENILQELNPEILISVKRIFSSLVAKGYPKVMRDNLAQEYATCNSPSVAKDSNLKMKMHAVNIVRVKMEKVQILISSCLHKGFLTGSQENKNELHLTHIGREFSGFDGLIIEWAKYLKPLGLATAVGGIWALREVIPWILITIKH